MGVITRMEPLAAGRVSLFVDGEYAFTVDKKRLATLGLETGAELADGLLCEIGKLERESAMDTALYMLANPRTEAQIRRKLEAKRYSGDIIDETVSKLIEKGYINDDEYAKGFAQAKCAKKSRREIASALMQRGIPVKMAYEKAAETVSDEAELEAALAFARKKAARGAEPAAIFRALYAKGFDADTANAALKRLKEDGWAGARGNN